jgi:uncharacterized protein YqeY
MMSVIEKLKAESITLRKTRNPVAPSILFALSEIEKVGKNNGNRATTDDEAIKVIQKLIATIDENLKVTTDDGRKVAFNFEKNILAGVLPEMASDQSIAEAVTRFMNARREVSKEIPKKGEFMKVLRDMYGAKVDMKRAGEIVTELYGI